MNLEAVIVDLLEDAALNAVSGEIPSDAARPILRVNAAGGPPSSSFAPDHLRTQDLQLDAYGKTKLEALDTAEAARTVLLAAPRSPDDVDVDLAVVLSSLTVTSPNWIPDEDWPDEDGRPGPRYLMNVSIVAHPKE